ncbi:MAG: 6-phosphofructokinase [Rudaea sp.]|uniref:6-phosphofructokinase n=1 Tax=unclassified Rudaea TaxID=2627037 RepID=UPI0010F611FA|nr:MULTISPECIES: 6-phosphofructokinase [unclassified Rudaea]MBN8886935.1 6-phosphofructokinase [Rudaea sp.]
MSKKQGKSGKGALFYAQSGGVTAVINASACGVIETCRKRGIPVYAGRNGILGALREELIDLSKEDRTAVAALRHTPGGAFGSCRFKLKSIEADRARYERLIDVCRAHDIRYFLYNGGNDSADTSLKISKLSAELGYDLKVVGVPKTVDNDLPVTDSCPGFGSVAKYTAVSITEASLDVESMSESSTKVFVMEVMGRHAGWIAAAAGLASHGKDAPPHVILFPEVPFEQDKFLARVKQVVAKVGYCSVIVSEGVKTADGKFLTDSGVVDAFGHTQLGGGAAPIIAGLVKDRLGFKIHWAVPDYLQRSARHLASKSDLEQAYAVGQAAVEYALAGKNAVMPVIKRTSSNPFKWKVEPAPITKIANIEKKLPANFISKDGFHITTAARNYFEPLIRGEAYPPYDAKTGLPKYVRLKRVLLKKKLPKYEIADK